MIILHPCGGHGSAEASPYNLPDVHRGLDGWIAKMNKLPNAFSLLDLDVEDDQIDTSIVTAAEENQTPNGSG
ncbi:hypothetical protein LIER_31052 [Lithospermum erythrorhizon]|uniref:Uncharacterized protein n=1 Tax=Lithospermum erythrorhizon TaxID=34254 RepID=A0AAV3RPN8_LITER